MPRESRYVYIISDLHIGGVYPETNDLGDRGFRICTHVPELTAFINALADKPVNDPTVELVINGDFLDFLAERRPEPPEWTPFLGNPAAAVQKLHEIVARDKPFFEALARFLARGHDLVLVLGNHDIELAIPQVRRALEELLDTHGRRFRFIYDGEAYAVGNALIEHGNRYDAFNVVDHDRLRRFRALHSRRQHIASEYEFTPPAGSKMVADVINPIKEIYQFVDLLKPEMEATIPLLLALDPRLRTRLTRVIPISLEARRHTLAASALPSQEGDIQSVAAGTCEIGGEMGGLGATAPSSLDDRRLNEVLAKVLGDNATVFLQQLDGARQSERTGVDIASRTERLTSATGLVSLLLCSSSDLDKRLSALLRAVQVLQNDRTFERDFESPSEYTRAAAELARQGGWRYVIFGHTHLARHLALPGGGQYFNTGTWADLVRFPKEILTGESQEVRDRLREFCNDMIRSHFEPYLVFSPTFVRLDVDSNDCVIHAALREYTGPASI
jgi:UDP-2,3-diacylglucosamine pyrophosphatase LpxH